MSVVIVLHEGESVEAALFRLRQASAREFSQPWYKKRLGYFEPPSALRRKRDKMRWLRHIHSGLLLRIPPQVRWTRQGPNCSAGR